MKPTRSTKPNPETQPDDGASVLYGGARQPEAMLSVLLKIVEKTASGGATKQDLLEACESPNGEMPSDKSIQRLVRRLNEFYDPGSTFRGRDNCEPDECKTPAIKAVGKKDARRYLFTREWTPAQKIDPAQALLLSLSLYPQQRHMVAEQFQLVMKRVFEHAMSTVQDFYSLQGDIEKYVYVTGYT